MVHFSNCHVSYIKKMRLKKDEKGGFSNIDIKIPLGIWVFALWGAVWVVKWCI
jgi:hypothetical protein